MLGIIIGVVAIGAMGILGNSMTQEISSSLSSVGDSVIVTPYSGGGGGGMGGGGGASSANLMLTDQNYQQIKRTVAPNVAIPVHSTSEHMKVGVGSDDIVATIYGLPTNDESDLLPNLQAGGYNNANFRMSGRLDLCIGSQHQGRFADFHRDRRGIRHAQGDWYYRGKGDEL